MTIKINYLNNPYEEIIKRDIECIEEVMITSLVCDETQVVGATGLNLKDSSLIYFQAKARVFLSDEFVLLFSPKIIIYV